MVIRLSRANAEGYFRTSETTPLFFSQIHYLFNLVYPRGTYEEEWISRIDLIIGAKNYNKSGLNDTLNTH